MLGLKFLHSMTSIHFHKFFGMVSGYEQYFDNQPHKCHFSQISSLTAIFKEDPLTKL